MNNQPPPHPVDFASALPGRLRRTEAEIDALIKADEATAAAKRARDLLEVCGLPPEHAGAIGLDPSKLPAVARAGLLDAERELKAWSSGQSIVALVGPRGVGKSSVAAAEVVRHCRCGKSARYVIARSYLQACTEGRGYGVKVKESEVERRFAAPLLLVIDELHQIAATDQDDAALKSLLQRRWDERRATVLIANETAAAIAQRLGASIVDRMRHRGACVTCNWASLRGRENDDLLAPPREGSGSK